jgi:P27 family predicted phage terminase small subunit
MPRPIKSQVIHELQGTKSQASVGLAPEAGRPEVPKGISGKARRAFRELGLMLEKRRALTPGDQEILRLYAHLYDRHLKALAKVAEEGEVKTYYRLDNHGEQVATEKPNLWLKIAQDSEARMHAILRDLGLTPSARKNVTPVEAPKEIDPLDAAMRKPAAPAITDSDVSLDDIDLDAVFQ